ncbi:MAG: TAXI family TRAP transporter solute-binding subunit [Burkholderiales bacterium]|nr:TAXI family TRAP transporter solute-binding subunit [Burkholderiales bacterium]
MKTIACLSKTLAMSAVAAAFVAQPAAATEYVKMSTLGPGSSPNLVMTTFATMVNQKSGGEIEIQVNATGAATKHAVEAAQGKIDLYMYSPLVHSFMQKKTAMYAKMDDAPALSQKLRALFSFPIGVYHIAVYADSGITSMQDIKGKKVFLGPPSGAATRIMDGLVVALTGYQAGKDYEAVKLGWGPAAQAFQDGQLDVYMNPTNAPSPVFQQAALTRKIRFLGIPQDQLNNPEVEKLYKRPGGALGTLPKGTYGANQVNDADVTTIKAVVGVGAGEHVKAELVYTMVKTFWDNIAAESKGTPWLRALKRDEVFDQMNMKLHPGAVKYYREVGLKIPEKLL